MIDLFGNDTQPATRMREGKYDMHKRRNKYRKATGPEKCKTCRYLVIREFAKRYYKCIKMGLSRCESIDIRVNNVCNLYQKPGTEAMSILTAKLQEL